MSDAADTIGLVQILEGAILAAGKPLTVQNMADLFEEHERPANTEIREALKEVAERCEGRGFELQEVASGFRFQVRQQLSPWIGRLWTERPAKYSRALLETLALIAYRQPITRGEIEEIRGVAVSSNIIKTLHERDWIRVVGHRDVPGRPAMYATTRTFLDYFNLKNLDQLPALAEIRDFDTLTEELGFEPIPELSQTAADTEGEQPAEGDGGESTVEDAGDALATESVVDAGEPQEAGLETETADALEDGADSDDDVEGEEPLSVDALRAAAESAGEAAADESAQDGEESRDQGHG